MKNTALLIVISLVCTLIISAAEQDPVMVLESEILNQLENEQWDSYSKDFVFNIWNEYRQAHLYTTKSQVTRSISGKSPDIKDYSEYLGTYTSDQYQVGPVLEIVKDTQDHFFVNLEGHKIPAVKANKCIIFTTGDVVYSRLPQFGEKPYCTLEMFIVIRAEGKFYFASPDSSPYQWREIANTNAISETNQSKSENPIDKSQEETNLKKEYEKLRMMNQNLEGLVNTLREQLQEMSDRIERDQKTITMLQQQLQNK